MDIRDNARTTPHSRLLMAQRLRSGWTVVALTEAHGVTARTVHKWRDRYAAEGAAGLIDRSSRPHRSPSRLGEPAEDEIGVSGRFVQNRTLRRNAFGIRAFHKRSFAHGCGTSRTSSDFPFQNPLSKLLRKATALRNGRCSLCVPKRLSLAYDFGQIVQ
jgi:transposase-like protein